MLLADAASDTPAKPRPNWELRILVPVIIVIFAVWLLYRSMIGSHAPTPGVFAPGLTLEQAQLAAKSTPDRSMVLADFTASWCPPCQQMKRTTWVDPAVERAVQSRGVAVLIDVDEQPRTAGAHRVQAMPTIVLFDGERELARFEGFRSAGELASWIERSWNAARP